MKIDIPKNCCITKETIWELKSYVKDMLLKHEEFKEFKIYLYSNFLKIKFQKKQFVLTIVSFNSEFFWYLKPYKESYLLIKANDWDTLILIFNIIKSLF